MPDETPGVTEVTITGDVVRRRRGPWSPRVHTLLRHLERAGFGAAPRLLGVDGGDELLAHLPGTVGHYPLTAAVRGTTALVTAARTLRALHDATAVLAPRVPGGWMLPDREPAEVVCHGDYAPYNLVFDDGGRVTGVIDFDTAHPGPRIRDVGYAVYRLAPLSRPEAPDAFGTVAEQAGRARRFCDAYGLADRSTLVAVTVDRLRELVAFIRERAAAGHPAFAAHVAGGHDTHYLADVAYLERNATLIRRILELPGG